MTPLSESKEPLFLPEISNLITFLLDYITSEFHLELMDMPNLLTELLLKSLLNLTLLILILDLLLD